MRIGVIGLGLIGGSIFKNILESKKYQTLYLNEEPNKLENISSENSYDEKDKNNSTKKSNPSQDNIIKISTKSKNIR